MTAKLVKSYTLPLELDERVKRIAREQHAGNQSAAVRALLDDALDRAETLPSEATKTA